MASAGTYAPVSMIANPGATFLSPPTRARLKAKRNDYMHMIYWLGCTEIILGCAAVVIGVVSLAITFSLWRGGLFFPFSGIFCGVFIILAGALGVRMRKTPSLGLFNANLTMSIISSLFMIVMFIMSICGLQTSNVFLMVLHLLLCILAVAGLVFSVVHSAFCCRAACCIQKRSEGRVVYNPDQPMQQFVQLANGQYMLTQGQQIISPNAALAATPSPMMFQMATPLQFEAPGTEEEQRAQDFPPPYSSQINLAGSNREEDPPPYTAKSEGEASN